MKKAILAFTLCASFLQASPAGAVDATCYQKAGAYYGISPDLLAAIATVESNQNNKAVNVNTNGTGDYCAMQINSYHLPRLQKFGITSDRLLSDECTCIFTGAFILAEEISRVGPVWQAVAHYHTRDKQRGLSYAQKVKNALDAQKKARANEQ